MNLYSKSLWKFSQLAFLLCVFLISNLSFAQTNYYVSTSGDDLNDGLSIENAWSTIQKAANTVGPNSTVNILEGTYFELVYINGSGSEGMPITYQNYEDDEVIISGSGSSTEFGNILSIFDKSDLVFDGLILENLITTFANGILASCSEGFVGMDNLTFKNLTVRSIGYPSTEDPPTSEDNAHGIEIYGQGITEQEAIHNVTIENCAVYSCVLGYSEAITINGNVDGYSIFNNTIYNNTNIAIDVAGNFGVSSNATLDHARNGIISGNNCYWNNSEVASASGVYCDGCQNTIIERNVVHHNGVGIAVGCEQPGTANDVVVRNNFSYQNILTGIAVGGYYFGSGTVEGATIYNNTLYQNNPENTSGQMRILKVTDCSIFNNIMHNVGTLVYYVENISPQDFTSDYNLISNLSITTDAPTFNYQWNIYDWDTYEFIVGNELNSLFDNVDYVDNDPSDPDLHIQAISVAIDAGDPNFLPFLPEFDIDGEARVNGSFDIGADEFYDASPPLAVCQDITIQLDDSGNVIIEATDIDGGSTADSGIASLEIDNNTFDCSHIGSNTVQLTVTDNDGLTSFCNSTVTVLDSILPIAICQDIEITLDETGYAQLNYWEIDNGSLDNCVITFYVLSQTEFNEANIGFNVVELTVYDSAGNFSTCTAIVGVSSGGTNPEAFCQDSTVSLDMTGEAEITWEDIDDGSVSNSDEIFYMLSQEMFDCLDLGNNSVELTVSNSSGNTATCISQVLIVDDLNPVALCQDIIIELEEDGDETITTLDIDFGSYDNCGIVTLSIDEDEFECDDLGANTVVLTAIDAQGNISSCTSVITVIDIGIPEISCPDDLVVEIDPETGFYELPDYFSDGAVSATDNCEGVFVSQNPTAGTLIPIGVSEVVAVATDPNGNTALCTFELTVVNPNAIGENNMDDQFLHIFPNPANKSITLSHPNLHNFDRVMVYDISGRLVISTILGSINSEYLLDIELLTSGQYSVVLVGMSSIIHEKLIIEK